MKILHTSDWHIGKKLINRDRLDEQKAVLDELIDICEQNKVELVLVAGDVFDTFVPSAEAETLFFESVKRLASDNRAVLIISGNHDDSLRLTACAPFGEELGIYMIGNRTQPISCNNSRSVRPVRSGEGFVVFENGKGEQVYVNALPYPNEARFHEEKTEESYTEKFLRWISRGQSAYEGGMPEIFLSHLFIAGGLKTENERDIDLGGARAVPLELLPDCDYIALGHLHKRQHFKAKNAWYSGSLLQYSFDEAGIQKYVILLETDKEKLLTTQEIPLQSGKQLVRVSANGVAEGVEILEKYPEEGYHVELSLHLSEPLSAEETKKLISYKCLRSLLPMVDLGENAGKNIVSRKGKNKEELFDEYYRSRYNCAPDEELKRLFLEIAEGGNDEV